MKKRVVGLLVALVFLVAGTAMGAQPCLSIDEVAYNGPEASGYLQTGVSQMVANRLGEAGVFVLETCDGPSLAISVTLFGGTANLGATIKKEGFHFSRSGAEGELIGFVQELADEVAATMTGKVKASPVPAPVVKEEAPIPDPVAAEGESLRSEMFSLEIQSVAMGDLTGDGVMEVVAASRGLLQLLSVSKQAITEEGRVGLPDYVRPVRLEVLDFNGDGKAELLLSAVHAASQDPLTLVYRHDGTTLVQMGKPAPFLSAVVTLPEGGRACIAQRLSGIDYWGDIHRVSLGAKGLELGQPLEMGDSFNVLGWDMAPLLKGEDKGYFNLSEGGRLGFWSDAASSSVYRSDENYGGSRFFLTQTAGSKKREERRYLVSRVKSVDHGALKGVGVLQHKDSLGHLFQGMKRYKNGRVVVVGWNGYELAPQATSAAFKGFLIDFDIVDIDGDGELEVFGGILNKKAGLSGKGRSYYVLSSLK
ncbi:FG-GAP repeat domain-containing protein [Desulfoluna spongiiphila]|uniref:FG-GAP repeat domain-containing protein n=1 Tax=Desulfoluna spongiiphila TaxID=419481 RepID=UPI00125EA8E5|nr:VCBS repeat-containing protein [Desulfoluna spongiiphila]